MKRRRDETYSGDLLDKMVALSNKYASREIKRLRGRRERDREEGLELLAKYGIGKLPGIPHEIEDFLQSVGA